MNIRLTVSPPAPCLLLQWQQTSALVPFSEANWISYDDINLRGDRTKSDVGINPAGNGGYTSRPEFDMFFPELQDFNDNGVAGEVFYMKFPPYDGDGDTNTNLQFHQCPG